MNGNQSLQFRTGDDLNFNQTEAIMGGPGFQVNPAVEYQINQNIAQGFGQFFFNALDPNISKLNAPVKLES